MVILNYILQVRVSDDDPLREEGIDTVIFQPNKGVVELCRTDHGVVKKVREKKVDGLIQHNSVNQLFVTSLLYN